MEQGGDLFRASVLELVNTNLRLADPIALLRGTATPVLAKFWPYQGAGEPENYSAIMAATQAMVASEILAAYNMVARLEGLFAEPASTAPLAGLLRMGRNGLIPKGSLVTLTLTGHGLKDPDTAMNQSEVAAPVVEPLLEAVLESLAFS